MKLAFPLFSYVLATQRFIRDTDFDECSDYQPPESLEGWTDAEIAELRALHERCADYWANNGFRAFGGNCFDCPCWCEARPWEETCNGETRGEFNKDIFLPYGPAAGDQTLTTQSLGVFASHTVNNDFFFYGKAYRKFHISSHGFIHLSNAQTTNPIYMEDRYNSNLPFGNENMIAAFWSDFNMQYDGRVHYRAQYDNFDQLNDIINAGTNVCLGDNAFEAVAAFVVTWDTMVITSTASGEVNDRRNTFQCILTQDAAGRSYVIWHYGDIEQDAGSYTDADDCTGLNGWGSWVGLADEFGNEYQLPISHTNDMEEIDKGTNVDVRGRYVLRVDQDDLCIPPVVVVTGAPPSSIDIDIDNQPKGIKEYITARGGPVNDNLSSIQKHGCHCAALGFADQASTESVDGLDTICKNWISARKCCHKVYGLCAGPNAPDYDFNNYVDSACEAESVCQNHVCDIDTYFFAEMENWFDMNNEVVFTPNSDPVCPENMGGNDREYCCGISPMTMTPYSAEHQECIDGQVFGIGMM